MRLILEFDKFKPEYRPIRLFKTDKYLINFDADKTEEKEKLVRSIINEYYPEIKINDTISCIEHHSSIYSLIISNNYNSKHSQENP